MIVYLVTNTVTGGRYVGVTSRSLDHRWREHCNRSKQTTNFKLSRAIQKYGPSAFSVEVLCELDTYEDLLEAERVFIANLGTFSDFGYNMTPGGETAPTRVKEIADRGGRTRSSRYRGVKHHRYGKKPSEETLAKRREAMRAVSAKPEWKAKMSELTRLSWQNEETRRKRIEGIKKVPKKPMSDETKRKLSIAKKAAVFTTEHREKLSRAAREMWAKRKRIEVGDVLKNFDL